MKHILRNIRDYIKRTKNSIRFVMMRNWNKNMKKREILEKISGQLIISCQAFEDNPLYGAENTLTMAECARAGGARALRICWPDQVKKIKEHLDLPVIGINKQFREGMCLYDDVFITPDYEAAREMIEAGSDIVALDGTLRNRTAKDLEIMIRRLKTEFPEVPLMADIATIEEGILCESIGFDILSTTLSGYTRETMSDSKEPDYRLAGELKRRTRCFVNAEGRIWERAQLVRMMEEKPDSVTIGTSVTNPMAITQRFLSAFEECRKAEKE